MGYGQWRWVMPVMPMFVRRHRLHCQDLECLSSIGIARLSINQGVLNFPEAFYR